MCDAIRDALVHIAKILPEPELKSCKMRSVIKEVDVFIRSATVSWHFTITAHNAGGFPFGVVEERETFVSFERPAVGTFIRSHRDLDGRIYSHANIDCTGCLISRRCSRSLKLNSIYFSFDCGEMRWKTENQFQNWVALKWHSKINIFIKWGII